MSGQLHAPAALPTGKNAGTHGIGGCLELRVCVDVLEKEKIFSCCEHSTPGNKSWRLKGGKKYYAVILTLTFGTNRTAELPAVGAGRTLPPFLLEAEWTTRLLNEDRRSGHLNISKDPTGNQTWDLPSCGSVHHATAPPITPSCQYRSHCINYSFQVCKR